MTHFRSNTEVTLSRRVALKILNTVEQGQKLDVAFTALSENLNPRDRSWCRELVYGVQRLRGRIDYLLNRKIHKGINSLNSTVRDTLRMSLYQILYMSSVPEYAAVSQAVELIRSTEGESATGFVNAVLRATVADGDGYEHFPDCELDPLGFLSTWGSHPRWLVERWLERWSLEDVQRLVEANNSVPSIYLRCLGVTPEEAIEILANVGIKSALAGYGTGCVVLIGEYSLTEAMAVVPSVVQDPASALVVPYVDPEPEKIVADLCSAPGGKTMAMAARGNLVIAADLSFERLGFVWDNIHRISTGFRDHNDFKVHLVQADAVAPVLKSADVVLLDVPCTGTGTLRRNPDARWKLTLESLKKLVKLQDRILEVSSNLLASGGLIAYSTCSLEEEENEDCISRFLQDHKDFEIDPGSGVEEIYMNDQGQLCIMPQNFGFDGAFASRLRKN